MVLVAQEFNSSSQPNSNTENLPKYIVSWSGGKDSTATVVLAHEHGDPIDEIVFAEVMYSDTISGEFPAHIDFIKNKAIPRFKEWGYKVTILHSEKNYLDLFYHYPVKGRYKGLGLRAGFPMVNRCNVNTYGKREVIKKYKKHLGNVVDYVGIAIDEPKRLARLKDNQISLLQKYQVTEQQAFEICKKYDLLSPTYEIKTRGGCWFCPNARYDHLKYLRTNHRDLWDELLMLEKEPNLIGNEWNTLEHRTIHDAELAFEEEDKVKTSTQ